MNITRIIDREQRFGANNYSPLPVAISRAQGVWVEDCDGKRYLDMMSAYSAVSHGHAHPRIVGAYRGAVRQHDSGGYRKRLEPLSYRRCYWIDHDFLPCERSATNPLHILYINSAGASKLRRSAVLRTAIS